MNVLAANIANKNYCSEAAGGCVNPVEWNPKPDDPLNNTTNEQGYPRLCYDIHYEYYVPDGYVPIPGRRFVAEDPVRYCPYFSQSTDGVSGWTSSWEAGANGAQTSWDLRALDVQRTNLARLAEIGRQS